jgi:polar amino acid transport system substrate-binding protein
MRPWLLIISIFCSSVFATAAEKTTYTLGTHNISYKPHYDFNTPETDSFAEALLQLFATHQHIQFKIVNLPGKRLNLEDEVDFIYPDNPLWRQARQHQPELFFSQSAVHILGTTMVPVLRQHLPLNKVKSIAVPRGFTPDHLLKVQPAYGFRLVETPDAESALKMVLMGRVDAADVELNVANFLLEQMQQAGTLVPGTALPFSPVSFHLSSARHPELIQAFDRFLLSHSQQIKQLKQHYKLKESLTD